MAQTASRLSAHGWYGISIGGTLAIMAVGIVVERAIHQILPFWIAIFAATAWGFATAGQAWKRVDEAAREAQKSAWFWGGTAGLVLALIITMTMPLARDTWHGVFQFIDARRGAWPLHALTFVDGVLFAAILQVVGFFFGITTWWTAKR